MRIPSESEINAKAQEMGLADETGRAHPRFRGRVAKALQDTGGEPEVDVEDLHEVIIRLDNRLLDAKVHHTVRAAAIGALVRNLTSVEVEVEKVINH